MIGEMRQAQEDLAWQRDGDAHEWVLPPKAAWPLRLWGVRFIRAMVLDYRVHKLAGQFAQAGIGLGPPNQRDIWIIYAVARGWC